MSIKLGTGRTIYDIILSVDKNNTPITATTFGIDVFRNGMTETGVTVSMGLTDEQTGVFTGSWSANTIGDYQVVYRNDITNELKYNIDLTNYPFTPVSI